MRAWHMAMGWTAIVAVALLLLWATAARLVRRDPGARYGGGANAVAILLLAQAAVGATLLVIGGGAPSGLHYLYGSAAPLVLLAGVGLGRALTRDRWVPVAVCALVALGLALRALTTGG